MDNVILPLSIPENPQKFKERAREVLAKVGMDHRLHHTPGQLSGGSNSE
ncbi:MAG: hypothetical protein CM1200mP16_01820 [Nitrospina sp.]|nr:MAG: hypothetical protein CM1200mP16_01820 [Nitrospina sp.]